MKTNFLKTRFNNQILHVAYNEDTLDFIRATDVNGKEVILDNYDRQIMMEIIIEYNDDLQYFQG